MCWTTKIWLIKFCQILVSSRQFVQQLVIIKFACFMLPCRVRKKWPRPNSQTIQLDSCHTLVIKHNQWKSVIVVVVVSAVRLRPPEMNAKYDLVAPEASDSMSSVYLVGRLPTLRFTARDWAVLRAYCLKNPNTLFGQTQTPNRDLSFKPLNLNSYRR